MKRGCCPRVSERTRHALTLLWQLSLGGGSSRYGTSTIYMYPRGNEGCLLLAQGWQIMVHLEWQDTSPPAPYVGCGSADTYFHGSSQVAMCAFAYIPSCVCVRTCARARVCICACACAQLNRTSTSQRDDIADCLTGRWATTRSGAIRFL